jgi:4-amino-4-deoxychorismate lyase
MHISLLNGVNGAIPLSHRGLAYGDGLFETLLADQSGPHFLGAHLDRLNAGARRMGMAWSVAQSLALRGQLTALCPHLDDPLLQQTDVLVQCSPYHRPDWAERGARVGLAQTHVSVNSTLAGMKHLNRLDSVLARQSARAQGVDEVLMATDSGSIIEASAANLFFFRGGRWSTPPVDQAGVAGVMREQLLARCPQIQTKALSVDELDQVEAAFLSNSLMGLVPIQSLMARPLPLHADIHLFQSELAKTCEKNYSSSLC